MTLEYFNVFPQYHYSTSDKIDLNPEYHEPWVWEEAQRLPNPAPHLTVAIQAGLVHDSNYDSSDDWEFANQQPLLEVN